MIDLHDYRNKLEMLARKFNLENLCGCQLNEFAKEISTIEPINREKLLAMVYLESLLQGFVYCYDQYNYWRYCSLIDDKKIAVSYHGAEIQFRLLLKIPENNSTFDKEKLALEVNFLGKRLLPQWLKIYGQRFGEDSSVRIRDGVVADADVSRLISEFPFLNLTN